MHRCDILSIRSALRLLLSTRSIRSIRLLLSFRINRFLRLRFPRLTRSLIRYMFRILSRTIGLRIHRCQSGLQSVLSGSRFPIRFRFLRGLRLRVRFLYPNLLMFQCILLAGYLLLLRQTALPYLFLMHLMLNKTSITDPSNQKLTHRILRSGRNIGGC